MINAYLFRTKSTPECTLGVLLIGDLILYTLERPWKNNAANKSCIPDSDYLTDYLAKSGSGRFDKTYHVKAVPNRSGILIHKGNVVVHTLGCILIGTKHGNLAGKRAVLSSSVAMAKLRRLVGKQSFKLHVMSYGSVKNG